MNNLEFTGFQKSLIAGFLVSIVLLLVLGGTFWALNSANVILNHVGWPPQIKNLFDFATLVACVVHIFFGIWAVGLGSLIAVLGIHNAVKYFVADRKQV